MSIDDIKRIDSIRRATRQRDVEWLCDLAMKLLVEKSADSQPKKVAAAAVDWENCPFCKKRREQTLDRVRRVRNKRRAAKQ